MPTFATDDFLVWGDDATPMVVDLLNEPEQLRDPSFARAQGLPSSARRKG